MMILPYVDGQPLDSSANEEPTPLLIPHPSLIEEDARNIL
jgi:hypothetical protein